MCRYGVFNAPNSGKCLQKSTVRHRHRSSCDTNLDKVEETTTVSGKQLDLNSFKNANINHLETSLPQMLNQIRVYPTHSINHSTPGSGGVPTTGATSGGASSLSATDRQQLNSVFGGITSTQNATNQALAE